MRLYRYVFPGIGLGAILGEARRITEDMVYASGAALPELLSPEELSQGLLYPALDRIQEISQHVALRVIRAAQQSDVDGATHLRDKTDIELKTWIGQRMYDPFVKGLENS